MGIECSEGSGDPGHMDINRKAQIDSDTMGIPPAHIRIMRGGGDRVRGRGADTAPMVATDSGRCLNEVYSKSYFRRCTGEEATVIRQAWWEGVEEGIRKRQVMAGDG